MHRILIVSDEEFLRDVIRLSLADMQAAPQEVVQAWIDSPTHRKAMLGEPYQYIGIGVYYLPEDTNHYYMYWDMLLISSQEPLEGARYPDSSTATSETAAAATVTTTQTACVWNSS